MTNPNRFSRRTNCILGMIAKQFPALSLSAILIPLVLTGCFPAPNTTPATVVSDAVNGVSSEFRIAVTGNDDAGTYVIATPLLNENGEPFGAYDYQIANSSWHHIEVTSQPANGVAEVDELEIIYKSMGFVGTAEFEYTAYVSKGSGPSEAAGSAKVTVTVLSGGGGGAGGGNAVANDDGPITVRRLPLGNEIAVLDNDPGANESTRITRVTNARLGTVSINPMGLGHPRDTLVYIPETSGIDEFFYTISGGSTANAGGLTSITSGSTAKVTVVVKDAGTGSFRNLSDDVTVQFKVDGVVVTEDTALAMPLVLRPNGGGSGSFYTTGQEMTVTAETTPFLPGTPVQVVDTIQYDDLIEFSDNPEPKIVIRSRFGNN